MKHILALVLITLTLHSNAQKKFYIIGKYNSPLADARVESLDSSFIEYSNEDGLVFLQKLPEHVFMLKITKVGYIQQLVNINELLSYKAAHYIQLQDTSTSLQEILLKSHKHSEIFKPIHEFDFHLHPITNTQDILRIVPGLFIGQHAGGGKAEQLFLRGFDLDHGTDIQIMVDGLPVNMVSHAHGQGYADLHWVIPELIDKVSFNKGPYQTEKGNLATAGFVDFKIKQQLDKPFIKAELGQFNTKRTVFGYDLLKKNKPIQQKHLIIGAEILKSDGYFDNPQDLNRINGIVKYTTNIHKKTSLSIMATSFTSKWNASGQIPERGVASGLIGFFGAIDSTEGGSTSRTNLTLTLSTYLANGATWRNQAYISKNKFTLFSNFTFFKVDPINGDQIKQAENRILYGYHGSYKVNHWLGSKRTEKIIGIQIRNDQVNDLILARVNNRKTTTATLMYGNVNETNTALYYNQKLELSEHIDITGGLRADYFKNHYTNRIDQTIRSSMAILFSPKLNIHYKLNRNLTLYWYNGKGFHSNDTRVAVQKNGKNVVPAGWGSDIGITWQAGESLYLQSALWHLLLDQEFIYVGDEGIIEPSGRSRRIGFDLSARYALTKHLFVDFDFNLSHSRMTTEPKGENYITLAPSITSVGGLTYKRNSGLNASFRYRLMSNRPAIEDNSIVAKGYTIFDATFNYPIRKWELGISIQNLFNTKWKETQFYTESRLHQEPEPVSEIHFTPGTPFFGKISLTRFL